MRISDWSSDVCSSDLDEGADGKRKAGKSRLPRAESVPELEKEREDQLHADEGGEEQRHSDDAGGESRFVKKPGLDEGRLAATHPRPLLPGKKQDAGAGSGDRKSTRLNSSH